MAKQAIEIYAEEQLPPARSPERLDHLIARILEDPAFRWPVAPPRDAVDEGLEKLRDQLRALNCDECVRGSDLEPCSGDMLSDQVVVARRGACITSIRDTFDFLRNHAEIHYMKAEVAHPSRVELETQMGTPQPAGGESLAFGGKVSYEDDDQGAAAIVEITIDVMSFDHGSLDTLPYVIAHEMYGHVFQHILGQPRSNSSKQYDILADGWMDYVAAEIIAGGPEARDHGPFNDSHVAAAGRRIHHARRQRGGPNPFPKASSVQIGYNAAFAVLALFRIQNNEPHDEELRAPWDDFRDLSLQLNAHAWTSEQRFRTLVHLPNYLNDRHPDLVDALLKWRYERNIQPVVAALLTLM